MAKLFCIHWFQLHSPEAWDALCNLSFGPPLIMVIQVYINSLLAMWRCPLLGNLFLSWHWSFVRLNSRKNHKSKSEEYHVPSVVRFPLQNHLGDSGELVCDWHRSISVDTNFFDKEHRYCSHRDTDDRSPKRWSYLWSLRLYWWSPLRPSTSYKWSVIYGTNDTASPISL